MGRAEISYPVRKASKSSFLQCVSQSIPPTKWSRVTKANRLILQRDMLNLQSQLKAEAMGKLPKAFKSIFAAQVSVFADEARRLGNRLGFRRGKGMKAAEWSAEEIALGLTLLREASASAFTRDQSIINMARGNYQSLIDRAYARARFLLGEADGLLNPRLASRNQRLLNNLKKVQVSTRNMADFRIKKAFDDAQMFRLGVAWGEAVASVAKSVSDRIIIPSRLTTLGRTEGGRAVDEGIKEAAKRSDIVSHMSVVGCKAVEPNIPTYNGAPTCNIEDVPVEDVDLVEFHINHTGAWIASRFRDQGI